MRNTLISSAVALVALLIGLSAVHAQTKAASGNAKAQPQAGIPDLSGNWLAGGSSFSVTDPGGKFAGTPKDDTPYQPWALAKLKSERPETGPHATFDTTDPRINYCDPIGLPRIYSVPNLFKFVQAPDTVYMLYEYGTVGLQIALNREHPKDPDPTWWGDSIGRYEGDTLVIDTVGFNDKTWLDHLGRPHSDELHLVQRFRRIDHDNLQLDVTIDDPKAYTRPWTGRKIFKLSQRDFIEHSCSMSENEHFRKRMVDGIIAPPKK
jgi:hypothetical protein